MDAEENQKQVSLRAHSPWKSQTARFPHSHRRDEAMEKWKTKNRFSTFPLPTICLLLPNSERRPGGGASLLLQAHCSIRICSPHQSSVSTDDVRDISGAIALNAS